MDRSNTETDHPQGDAKLLIETLDVLKMIHPMKSLPERIDLLRKSIACAKNWYPITNWGVKKIHEHFTDRVGRFFEADSSNFDTSNLAFARSVALIAPRDHGDCQLGFYPTFDKGVPASQVSVFLFLAQDGDIIALKAHSKHLGDRATQAHRVEALIATDDFLFDLIRIEHGLKGNQDLIVNAAESLCLTLFAAQMRAQERVARIGTGQIALGLISRAMKEVWQPT